MTESGYGSPSGPGGTPPGWYPDAQVAGQNRWWDGSAWTDHVQPAAAASGDAPYVGFGEPTPAPHKSKRKKWYILGGVVVVLIALGALGAVLNQDKADNAKVGDCLKVNSFDAENADLRRIDCGAQDAVLQVGLRLKSTADAACPDEDYVQYYEKGAGVDDFSLCLIYNVKKGECIFDGEAQLNRIECSAGPGPNNVRIVEVLTGVNDPSKCPGDSSGPAYPTPPLTICGKPL